MKSFVGNGCKLKVEALCGMLLKLNSKVFLISINKNDSVGCQFVFSGVFNGHLFLTRFVGVIISVISNENKDCPVD
jgi:hypothetical protein